MYNPVIEALVDSASYETLQKENPSLLAAIEKCLAEGEKAKSIEKRIRRRFGDELIALLVASAAHHIKRRLNDGYVQVV